MSFGVATPWGPGSLRIAGRPRVEDDIERNDLAQRRQYLASLLDPRPPAAAVEHDVPQAGHEGLSL
jgi:hypothetical protein